MKSASKEQRSLMSRRLDFVGQEDIFLGGQSTRLPRVRRHKADRVATKAQLARCLCVKRHRGSP